MNKLLLIMLPICSLLSGAIATFRAFVEPPSEAEKEGVKLHFDSLIDGGHYLEALGFVAWGTASTMLFFISVMITMHLWGKIRN